MAIYVTFRNLSRTAQAVKVFYGPSPDYCVDKPYRKQFRLEPGKSHDVDVGNDLCCYCYNDVQQGVPPEDCVPQQARPGNTVDLF